MPTSRESTSPCRSGSLFFFFFFNDTATTEIYTLSLHDALPIHASNIALFNPQTKKADRIGFKALPDGRDRKSTRLNSSHVAISYAVFCLKKKNKKHTHLNIPNTNNKTNTN